MLNFSAMLVKARFLMMPWVYTKTSGKTLVMWGNLPEPQLFGSVRHIAPKKKDAPNERFACQFIWNLGELSSLMRLIGPSPRINATIPVAGRSNLHPHIHTSMVLKLSPTTSGKQTKKHSLKQTASSPLKIRSKPKTKKWRFGRWFSFSKGWFSGSSR